MNLESLFTTKLISPPGVVVVRRLIVRSLSLHIRDAPPHVRYGGKKKMMEGKKWEKSGTGISSGRLTQRAQHNPFHQSLLRKATTPAIVHALPATSASASSTVAHASM
jgi:hypothetical protein